MHAMRIFGLVAMMAVITVPLAVHAEPDQKNNRGYVVGKGGVARSAETPQPEGGEPGTTASKQTQGATFGERVNRGIQQTGNAVASGAALQGGISPTGKNCTQDGPACPEGASPANRDTMPKTRHDTVKNTINNIR